MFKQHALLVDTLCKVRLRMNKIFICHDRSSKSDIYLLLRRTVLLTKMQLGRHPTKDALLNILSLADQLYRSRSTNLDGFEPGTIYFSENLVPDLLV